VLLSSNVGYSPASLFNQVFRCAIRTFIVINHYAGHTKLVVRTVEQHQRNTSFFYFMKVIVLGGFLGHGSHDTVYP
jgi:hypothetical protein